jgi:hypothetical protein
MASAPPEAPPPPGTLRLAARRTQRKVGRRGTFLAILALIDFGYGSGLISGYVPLFAHGTTMVFPLVAWGWIWVTVGVICLTGVPLRHDRIQFAVAALLKTAWAALIAVAWLENGIPGGWTSVAAWGGIAMLVLLASGWPDVRRR